MTFHQKNNPLDTEQGVTIRKYKGTPTIALAYLNSYAIGMSNLAIHTLYKLLNDDAQTVCERVFFDPSIKTGHLSALKKTGSTLSEWSESKGCLRTFETGQPVKDCDCVMMSISFESDFLNLLPLLTQAKIPFLTSERDENDPIIIAGGAAVTINPKPIADFCDAVFMGEADEAMTEIVAALRTGSSKKEKLEALKKVEGIWICNEPHQYHRRVVKDINKTAVHTEIYTPQTEMGDMALVEIQRGCPRGCKFCAAGFIYAPFRERNLDLIKKEILEALQYRKKIGLIGADLLSSPHLNEIMQFVLENGGTSSPSSVRVDGLTSEILELLVKSGHKTLSIAPETGSDSLRKSLNKNFSNELILQKIEMILKAGLHNLKTYFMIGLPEETDADVLAIIQLVKNIRALMLEHAKTSKKMGTLTVSVNAFIPKPHTPLSQAKFEDPVSLKRKVQTIKKSLDRLANVKVVSKSIAGAEVQAKLSNGGREMGVFLVETFHKKNQR